MRGREVARAQAQGGRAGVAAQVKRAQTQAGPAALRLSQSGGFACSEESGAGEPV